MSYPSTASTRYGSPEVHTRVAPLSVLTTRTRTFAPSAASTVTSPDDPLMVGMPS